MYTLTDDSVHTLSSVSYGSPPTEVIWERDGERIYFNDTYDVFYHSNQVLLNRTTSAYNNTLTINATIEDVIGEYSCTIVNSAGRSDTLTRAIKGQSRFLSTNQLRYSSQSFIGMLRHTKTSRGRFRRAGEGGGGGGGGGVGRAGEKIGQL